MTEEDKKKWENYYIEVSVKKDFERNIYEQCDKEDEEELKNSQ